MVHDIGLWSEREVRVPILTACMYPAVCGFVKKKSSLALVVLRACFFHKSEVRGIWVSVSPDVSQLQFSHFIFY